MCVCSFAYPSIVNVLHNDTLKKSLHFFSSRKVVGGEKALEALAASSRNNSNNHEEVKQVHENSKDDASANSRVPPWCSSRVMKNRFAVHFSPLALQRAGAGLPFGEWRLPKHRLEVARNWLAEWNRTCRPACGDNSKSMQKEET